MNVIWDLNNNFWDVNPLFELHFRDTKEEDLSKNKRWSSYRMWCLALRSAPDSPIAQKLLEEQLIFIYDNYLVEHDRAIDELIVELNLLSPDRGNKGLNKKKEAKENTKENKEKKKELTRIQKDELDRLRRLEKYKSFIFDNDLDAPMVQRFINVTHSKVKKLLRNWEDKLEEWQLFIDKTKVGESTYEMLGKMMVQSHTMWKQYYIIKKEADAELTPQGMGGAQKSFLEQEDY